MKEYNIDDKVWIASHGQKEVRKDCPVCYGQLFVTLVLGNGDEIRTPCDYCGKGYEGPKGYVLEYEYVAEPRQVTITDKTKAESSDGIKCEYRSYDAYFDEVFDTKEEAEAKTLENIKEHEEQERKNIEWRKSHNHKTYSWHVGYSLKEIKEAKRKLDWHNQRVILMGKRSKPEKAAKCLSQEVEIL
jgi:hypothetical protein